MSATSTTASATLLPIEENLLTEIKRLSLVKPTVATPIHIDFDWWQQNDRDWSVYLFDFLCPEHRLVYANVDSNEEVDWIDPQTAEVSRVDALRHVLRTHCARSAAFSSHQEPLVDSVFRIFLANGNQPMTTLELAAQLEKDPYIILRTLFGSSGRVYKGLRPCLN